MSIKTINLTTEELKKILAIVEELNPAGTLLIASGRVDITIDNSSGIGSIVTATVPVKIGEHWGEFTTRITGEESW